MWNAPQASATSPSRASACLQSTSTPPARGPLLAVDEHRLLRAVQAGTAGDGADVGLVVLAEVGGEGVRDAAVLAHPRDRAARVEPTREGDPDALADRQRVEDGAAAGGLLADAHAASPAIRWR